MKKMIWMIAAFAMVTALCTSPAFSQDKAASNMQLVVEKIKADKKLLVAENMQLSETEANAFWPVYQKYQDELMGQRGKAGSLIKEYADAYGSMTKEQAKKIVDQYMALESSSLKLRQSYLPKFRKVLPEVKVARYYQIENKIQAALMYELASQIPLAK
jgi:calcineurin-like phosphoesterase family protein